MHSNNINLAANSNIFFFYSVATKDIWHGVRSDDVCERTGDPSDYITLNIINAVI